MPHAEFIFLLFILNPYNDTYVGTLIIFVTVIRGSTTTWQTRLFTFGASVAVLSRLILILHRLREDFKLKYKKKLESVMIFPELI